MPFVYRLQKILDFRIRKKEEQLLEVQRAQSELAVAEANIRRNNDEIEQIKVNQRTADYRMMESYDKYLHHLWEKAEKLEEARQEAENRLKEEVYKLIELEKAVKVLEKHKEKNRDAYLEEEKKIELKNLSEIGTQRHFQHTRQENEQIETDEEILRQIKLMEGETLDEY